MEKPDLRNEIVIKPTNCKQFLPRLKSLLIYCLKGQNQQISSGDCFGGWETGIEILFPHTSTAMSSATAIWWSMSVSYVIISAVKRRRRGSSLPRPTDRPTWSSHIIIVSYTCIRVIARPQDTSASTRCGKKYLPEDFMGYFLSNGLAFHYESLLVH